MGTETERMYDAWTPRAITIGAPPSTLAQNKKSVYKVNVKVDVNYAKVNHHIY
jgi:hypothetical protein